MDCIGFLINLFGHLAQILSKLCSSLNVFLVVWLVLQSVMPEVKPERILSFSSEDKVFKQRFPSVRCRISDHVFLTPVALCSVASGICWRSFH